jgi:hypothetical protein
MSITANDATFAFPPFYAIVETGLKQILEFVKSYCFTIRVTDHLASY